MKKKESLPVRTFSEDFKKEKVKLILEGKLTVVQVHRLYQVNRHSVYKWIRKYGHLPPTERVVIEKKSEGAKNIELLDQIKKLEGIIGKMQVEIVYKETIISLGSELCGEDLKKKLDTKPSSK